MDHRRPGQLANQSQTRGQCRLADPGISTGVCGHAYGIGKRAAAAPRGPDQPADPAGPDEPADDQEPQRSQLWWETDPRFTGRFKPTS